MELFHILAILLTLTALFSYVNHRYIGLPVTIGVMLIALIMSLCLMFLDRLGLDFERTARTLLSNIDFGDALLHGMLSFLLFAGALHININDLAERKWAVCFMSTFGTLLSVFLVGSLTWLAFDWLSISLSYTYCLLFGALISPTDPIAVLSILKRAGAPKSLEIKITGESLFNDGIGVVVFLIILEVATGADNIQTAHVARLFAQEALGGGLFGLAIGFIAYLMLKSVDNYQVEVLLTLALVTGGYALAGQLHLSGPIAIVVAGLLIGNHGRLLAMSDTTRHHLDIFWELIDEILNAVLFVLIGLEVMVLTFTRPYILAGLIVIPIVLGARFVSVGSHVGFFRPFRSLTPGVISIMTWGGLRGGISVALALSLPPSPQREMIVAMTYPVVVFSILVQGLTIGPLVRWMLGRTLPMR